jgi:hypothetical protein
MSEWISWIYSADIVTDQLEAEITQTLSLKILDLIGDLEIYTIKETKIDKSWYWYHTRGWIYSKPNGITRWRAGCREQQISCVINLISSKSILFTLQFMNNSLPGRWTSTVVPSSLGLTLLDFIFMGHMLRNVSTSLSPKCFKISRHSKFVFEMFVNQLTYVI